MSFHVARHRTSSFARIGHGFGDLEAEAARLRSTRNWELASVLVSGAAGVTSLALFATGRYTAGYALAATSALVGGVLAVLRISSDYDKQVTALQAGARTETP